MNNQVGEEFRAKLKHHSRDTYNSLKPINGLLNLFAINSNFEDASYSKAFFISKSLLALTILGSLNMFSLYYKHKYIYENTAIIQSVKLTDTVQMVFDLIQYIVDLWFIYKYGRHISLGYFKQYEYIDAILNMTCYSEIKWKLVKLISLSTFIWLSSSACDFVAWSFSYGWVTPTLYAVAYIFLYLKMLTTLDLSSHVIHIKYRLEIIGDIVQHYYSATDSLPGFRNYLLDQCWVDVSSRSTKLKLKPCVKLQSADRCIDINLLTRCYLQLTEQVEFINRMFGVRILLNSLSLLIDIIRFTNIAVRIVLGSQVMPNESRYVPATSSMIRQLTCVLVLICPVYQCEKVYHQRKRIISTIDHILINKNPDSKLREVLTELRGLMQARPINFNLANFFRLDNNFLVSITSVVVTYTIILLQSM